MDKKKQIEEKAIEEMARVIEITEQIARDAHCGLPSPRMYAKDLYWKGYRKQSENTVELPCKIGDTVYRVKKRRGVWCILPREVVSITYRLDHLHRVVWEIFSTETDVLGKDVFLTEAEAEEALAKMKGGEQG